MTENKFPPEKIWAGLEMPVSMTVTTLWGFIMHKVQTSTKIHKPRETTKNLQRNLRKLY